MIDAAGGGLVGWIAGVSAKGKYRYTFFYS
jgi:hypothetical protein